MKERKKIILARIVLVLILLGIGFSSGWWYKKHTEAEPNVLIREVSPNYKFVHPILLLQVPEDDTTPELQSLKKTLTNYVTTATSDHKATNVSVYFRELETNKWVGVNADDTYAPGSMLKVASMVAFFRAYQDDPSLLSKKVTLRSTNVGDEKQDYYPPQKQAKLGETYSGKELLEYMISYSDNNALEAINFLTGVKTLNKTYTDLRIPIPTDTAEKVSDSFTVKMISRLYRALYNGTYISQSLSEQALELLTKTDFDNGLVVGIPKGITVAHKFGEKTITTINNGSSDTVVHELHDCGIVYVPTDPYFLCVMTKGDDFDTQATIIQDISRTVWNQTQTPTK